jgi:tetratricopeptide (TPR) repeat protein
MSEHLDYEINKELGECYLYMGDLEKAEEYYTKAASNNGVHPDPYLGLATICVQRGELDKAHGLYAKAADIEADDKSLAGMALIEMERGEIEPAYAHLEGALEKNPANLVALFSLVRIAHATERVEDAIRHMENYLAIDPLKAQVRYSLAGSLICMGRDEEAKAHLVRILDEEPDFEPARELLEQQAA